MDVIIDRVTLIRNYSNLNVGVPFPLHDEEQALRVPDCVGISVAVIQFCYYHCGLLYDRLLLINNYTKHIYWIKHFNFQLMHTNCKILRLLK